MMRVQLAPSGSDLASRLDTVRLDARFASTMLEPVRASELRLLRSAGVETYGDVERSARRHLDFFGENAGTCLEDVPGLDSRTVDVLDRNVDAIEAARVAVVRRQAEKKAVSVTVPFSSSPSLVAEVLGALLADEGEAVRG
ncbi:hypothetical protein [Antarcticirhabdus aurantiaca]|uniref:hypothetical protein n=1 Tax=Antarcticirhabdus aurantiaca TaxID=2606717 RepID=UPI00131B94B8|nr:hypothetical protein [Antarcticirhabdus aurantiaca]